MDLLNHILVKWARLNPTNACTLDMSKWTSFAMHIGIYQRMGPERNQERDLANRTLSVRKIMWIIQIDQISQVRVNKHHFKALDVHIRRRKWDWNNYMLSRLINHIAFDSYGFKSKCSGRSKLKLLNEKCTKNGPSSRINNNSKYNQRYEMKTVK